MSNATGSLAATQGYQWITATPNDILTITVNPSATYSLESPLGTFLATGATTTQTFYPNGPCRLVLTAGSVTWSLTDRTDTSQNITAIPTPNTTGWTITDPDGAAIALSEAQPIVTITATGLAFTGTCEFRGITVSAISGTPQTVTVYDATSATGTPIATFTVSALGTYFWDGDWVTVGSGKGGRRINSTGCYVSISGGTSRTIDVQVG